MSTPTNLATTPVVARIPGFEEPPAVIEHTQTNMPNWGGTGWNGHVIPPESAVIAFTFGPDAAGAWQILLGIGEDTQIAHLDARESAWTPAAADAVERAIEGALAGMRLAFVGPEPTVLAAIALAKKLGLNDEEFLAAAIGTVRKGVPDEGFSTATCLRPIFCARCHNTYTALLAVGDAFDCPVCGTPVAVYYHYSPLRGAYLARPTGEEKSA